MCNRARFHGEPAPLVERLGGGWLTERPRDNRFNPRELVPILATEDHDRWLAGSYDEVLALRRPYPASEMTVRGPVFPRMGQR